MANTYNDYTGDGSNRYFDLNFEYLQDNHVKVKVDGAEVGFVINTDLPTKRVYLDTAPANLAKVKVYRDSRGDFSPLVDFEDGSVLTQVPLDLSYKHNLFVSQEASEGTGNQLLTKKDTNDYDAEGNKIINLGSPTTATDAATKSYVDQTIDNAELVGGSPATVSLGVYDVTSTNDTLKQLRAWTADIEDTSGSTVTATGSSEARSLEDRFADFVNVKDFGALGNDDDDDTQAFKNAITYCEQNLKKLYVPQGTYKITDILYIGKAIPIEGEFQSSTINMGTTIKHYSNSTLFYYNSDAVSGAQNTGGGISKMLIVKAEGYSGGNAIIVYNQDNDGDSNKQASTFNFSELTISSQSGSGGFWQHAILLDGLQYNTSGARGLRNISFYKVRVAGCTEDNAYILLKQVTHFNADMLQIDTGAGTGSAGITLTGYSQNVFFTNCNINGTFYIPSTAAAVIDLTFSGHFFTLDNQLSTTTGAMLLSSSPSITNQSSNELRLYDTSGNGLRYLLAGTQTGYSNKIIAMYSGNTELCRLGSINEQITSIIPQKNTGQVWVYANASDYETSGTQQSYKFEYTRFRPNTDNATSLGFSSNRWSEVYAATGTINTSDKNEKQQVEDLSQAELQVATTIKGLIKKFKFNDAVEKKGDDARIHVGVIAQDVEQAFITAGLNPEDYGIFCRDVWWSDAEGTIYEEEGEGRTQHTRLGVRYEELLAFVISSL